MNSMNKHRHLLLVVGFLGMAASAARPPSGRKSGTNLKAVASARERAGKHERTSQLRPNNLP